MDATPQIKAIGAACGGRWVAGADPRNSAKPRLGLGRRRGPGLRRLSPSHPGLSLDGFQGVLPWAVAALWLSAACVASAGTQPVDRTEAVPPELQGVGIDNKIGAQVPLDLVFTDDSGRTVRLGDLFKSGRPVILNLIYFNCPAICSPLLQSLIGSCADMPADFSVGQQYDVITLSFDPLETAALANQKKQNILEAYGRPGGASGWHVLTGEQANIAALTDAVGFRYKWDPKGRQYVHEGVLIILSPQGNVTHYIRNVVFEPRSLKLALIESSQGKVGSAIDRFALFTCYRFDESSGRYVVAAAKIVRFGGLLSIVMVACLVGGFALARRRRRAPGTTTADAAPASHAGPDPEAPDRP